MPLTSMVELRLLQSSPEATLRLGRRDEQKSSYARTSTVMSPWLLLQPNAIYR
jgi:hypothetical protein